MAKTIRNYELKIKRVQVADGGAPYGESIHESGDVAKIARSLIGDSAQEVFCILHLDVKNKVLGYTEAFRGGISTCGVDPRVIFRAAIAVGATSIVLAHSHPSGDLTPSTEDISLTNRLIAGGEILGVAILDHVIVTDRDASSMRARGLCFV